MVTLWASFILLIVLGIYMDSFSGNVLLGNSFGSMYNDTHDGNLIYYKIQ